MKGINYNDNNTIDMITLRRDQKKFRPIHDAFLDYIYLMSNLTNKFLFELSSTNR